MKALLERAEALLYLVAIGSAVALIAIWVTAGTSSFGTQYYPPVPGTTGTPNPHPIVVRTP